eukprot:984643-Pleurochrysis_carterae.AAC.2
MSVCARARARFCMDTCTFAVIAAARVSVNARESDARERKQPQALSRHSLKQRKQIAKNMPPAAQDSSDKTII